MGRAVLLIEDDPAIGEMIAELLRSEGYPTTIATSVTMGIALLHGQQFALILSDAFAGGAVELDRWQSLEQIRRVAGAVPMIICTAHRADEFVGHAARGYAAFLEKPFDLDDLLALMGRLLREREDPAASPPGDQITG